MRKSLFCFMVLISYDLFSGNVKRLTCPESIICNYEKGHCIYENPREWRLYSGEAKRYFGGAIRINFSEAGIYNDHLLCAYGYDYLNSNFFVLVSESNNLYRYGIGWHDSFAGFGKTYKSCNSYAGNRACSVLVKIH